MYIFYLLALSRTKKDRESGKKLHIKTKYSTIFVQRCNKGQKEMENVQKSSHINKKILFILNWYVNKMFSSHCIPLAKAQNLTGNDTW